MIRAGSGQPPGPARSLRRRGWKQAPFAALDFESTGLDFERDSIVSYGVVPVDGGRIVVGGASYQEVAPDVAPSRRSITVHELRPADLAGAPPVAEALGPLGRALEGRFLLTWSAGVEVSFLSGLFGGARRSWYRRTVDVMRLAMALERSEPYRQATGDFRLAAVAARYGVPADDPHHALGDALMTAGLFLVLATKLEARGYRTVRHLLRQTVPPRRRPGTGFAGA
ncbi:MAG TPA: 3'-5' exonuclease [Actinomycetota bacterium]|jgi:DNA polymerase-3 subunit epsilon